MGIAAKLDSLVQFQRASLVDDGFSSVEVWAPYGTEHPALRQDVKDGEKWMAGQVQAQISTRFHIRDSEFTRTITARDRIICEGQTFEIVGVKQVFPGRRQLIEISAVANE
jgi:head-tail adaptor